MVKNIDLIDVSKREQVSACAEAAKENKDILKLIVFGSAAKNQCTDTSDLDLCVELKPNADRLAYHYTVANFGRICNHHYDLLNFSILNDKFKNEITQNGVIVYELS